MHQQEDRMGLAWGHMKMALRSLRGKGVPSPEPEPPIQIIEAESEMPQACTREDDSVLVQERDWRSYFSQQLRGRGLEIGPLHRPMVKHEGQEITYVDRFTVKQLRDHYPELKELPLVEADLLGDAQNLDNVADGSFDFVTAAHVIEHMRDPIKALVQWCRVVKPGGLVYLVAPDKRATFDRQRVRTTLEHMILDFLIPSAERDYEHYLDYALHCNKKALIEAVDEADRLVAEDYSIHYHVFIPSDLRRLVEWTNENVRPVTIVEGPCKSPSSDEFHLLIRAEPIQAQS